MPGPEHPARLSPPTDRVLDVLEAVAGTPARGWSVGELARHTGLTKSTCLGIVNALLGRSYLIRLDTTVALGPGFARLRGAVDSDTALELVARPHLAALAEEHGARVALSVGRSEGVTVIAAEGSGLSGLVPDAGGVQPWVATGMSYVAYVAWSPDEVVVSRLDNIRHQHDEAWLEQARKLVARCRADGHCVMQVSSTMLRL
jgi:DNA-binding IclR family transcriptional regulator